MHYLLWCTNFSCFVVYLVLAQFRRFRVKLWTEKIYSCKKIYSFHVCPSANCTCWLCTYIGWQWGCMYTCSGSIDRYLWGMWIPVLGAKDYFPTFHKDLWSLTSGRMGLITSGWLYSWACYSKPTNISCVLGKQNFQHFQQIFWS